MAALTIPQEVLDHYDSEDDIEEQSDSEVGVAFTDNDEPFRVMDLPGELRMRIWRMVVSDRSRISLDPDNIRNPGAFLGTQSINRDIVPILRISKAVYNEIIPVLYSSGTFCLIEPSAKDDALGFVGALALSSMMKLELKVKYGLTDLGAIWDDLTQRCTQLKELKLIFVSSFSLRSAVDF
jgi:hypothetical protein